MVPQNSYMAVSPGLYRITIGATDRQSLSIRYGVHGDVSRIPIAIPDTPAQPGRTQIQIRIVGVSPTALLRDGFPRLVREPHGSAVARLENLPNFVRMPPDQRQWSVNRISETGVALIALLATTCWLLWRRTLSHSMTA